MAPLKNGNYIIMQMELHECQKLEADLTKSLSCGLDSGDSGRLYLSWFLPWFRGTALVQSRFLAKHELGKL